MRLLFKTFCYLPLILSLIVIEAQAQPQQIIRSITIEIDNVFEEDDLKAPYTWVNALKIQTKEDVVRRELLFKVGDTYDQFLVDESIRQLRSLGFVRNITIQPLPSPEGLDMIVQLRDTWTLFPNISFTLGSDKDKSSIAISEENLLGYGKRLQLKYEDDEGRERYEAVYDDRRVLGTKQRFQIGHFERSDGYNSTMLFGNPYRNTVQKNAWSINTDFSDLVGRLFEAGDERFIYRNRHQEVGLRYSWAIRDPGATLHRFSFGYEYIEDKFKEASDKDFIDADVNPENVSRDPDLLADNRKFSGPTLAYELLNPEFISLAYVDRFDRTDDYALGRDVSLKLTFAADALGSAEDTLLTFGNISDGWKLSPTSFIRAEAGLSSRFSNSDGLTNSLARAEAKYVNAFGPTHWGNVYLGNHTFIGSVMLDYGDDLDKDREFLLGALEGLRGYKSRSFTGDKRFLINLEERIHLVENVLKLFNFGAAVFADAGGTSQGALGRIFSDNFYANVGLGLRVGFPRSSGGSVLRIDVAFPVRDGVDDDQAWEPRLVISTGQALTARLRSESLGPERANVEIGLDR